MAVIKCFEILACYVYIHLIRYIVIVLKALVHEEVQ